MTKSPRAWTELWARWWTWPLGWAETPRAAARITEVVENFMMSVVVVVRKLEDAVNLIYPKE
jgi:hypothetical protein